MSEQSEFQFQHRRRASSNRQRPKVRDGDRKRIAVACDHCKTRKIRCTGEQPCRQCYISNIACNYPPTSAKIMVPELYVDKLQARIFALEKAIYDGVPDQAVRKAIAGRFGISFQDHTGSINSSSGEPSPTSPKTSWPEGGPFSSSNPTIVGEDFEAGDESDQFQSYSEGYSTFIGDSAGATFIDKIRDFIRSSHPHIPRNISYMASHSFPVDPALSFTSVTSSHFTHDSLPLSLPAADPYVLPQKATVLKHLEVFLKLCACGTVDHAVADGGIFYWFNPTKIYVEIESLYDATTYGPFGVTVSPVDNTSLSAVNMILALSCQVMATSGTSSTVEDGLAGISPLWHPFVSGPESISPHLDQTYPHAHESSSTEYTLGSANALPGITFFARAKLLLVNPVEEASSPSLRIIALMSFYLLSANRRDEAYMYIGLAVRMAVSHGLHRTWRKGEWVSGGIGRYSSTRFQGSTISSPEDQFRKRVQYEERKREFWNIYILDRIFSCSMGRPVMLSDEDIDVDLPLDIGDALPSSAGLSAHVRLSKIMGDVVNTNPEIYCVRKTTNGFGREIGDVVGVIGGIHNDLRSWEESLPPGLKLITGVAHERPVLLLHFLHNQLHILTTRPSLLLAAKQRTAEFCLSSSTAPQMPPHIEQHAIICANAARRNIALGRQLQSSGLISHHSFTDYHYLFNATIVLLLNRLISHEMQQCTCTTSACSTPNSDEEDIRFSIALLSSFGERGNGAAAASAETATELSVIVQRMVLARDNNSPASPSTLYPNHGVSNIAVSQYEIASFLSNHFNAAGNPPDPIGGYSAKQYRRNLEAEDVCTWLQSGHFD